MIQKLNEESTFTPTDSNTKTVLFSPSHPYLPTKAILNAGLGNKMKQNKRKQGAL